jgi:hypothetical protein
MGRGCACSEMRELRSANRLSKNCRSGPRPQSRPWGAPTPLLEYCRSGPWPRYLSPRCFGRSGPWPRYLSPRCFCRSDPWPRYLSPRCFCRSGPWPRSGRRRSTFLHEEAPYLDCTRQFASTYKALIEHILQHLEQNAGLRSVEYRQIFFVT